MKNIILMAREIAQGLSDEELAKDIAELESGKKKLPRLLSPYRRVVVAVYRREQENRRA